MIAIGCDHSGYNFKNMIKEYLGESSIKYKDFGSFFEEPTCVEYPDIAFAVGCAVAKGEFKFGILCCGTGIGFSIAANKVHGVRAACCSDYYTAKYTRLHNDANILCLGSRVLGRGLALELVNVFLNTDFEGGRHIPRISKIRKIEEGTLLIKKT